MKGVSSALRNLLLARFSASLICAPRPRSVSCPSSSSLLYVNASRSCSPWQKQNGVAAQEPRQLRERGRGFEHSLRDIDVDGEAAAHRQRLRGFDKNVRAFDFGGRFALLGTVDAGEGLSAQPSGGIFGEGHEGRGMVDGNRPIVAGHVPVELGVIIVVTVEEADAITNGVVDVDYARRVDRAGNVDLEIAVGSGLARVVLQLISVFVGDAQDVEKQRVVGSLRAGILDWYGAVNAVPLAGEGESDFFADQGRAIGGNGDGVFEIGDTPVVGLGSGGAWNQQQSQEQEQELYHRVHRGTQGRTWSRPAGRFVMARSLVWHF